MSVCKDLKSYSRRHEWFADFFSLLSVALLFATLYGIVTYHQQIINWLQKAIVVNGLIAVALVIIDVFLMFAMLNIGSARFAEEDEGCFRTFKGRRQGSGSLGMMFNSWLRHMEHVGKKHR